jgi:hypothetical protein
MNTQQLEFKKMDLINEILALTDERKISKIWDTFYRQNTNIISFPKKRKLGGLKGKMIFSEVGDGKITTEEFLGI